MVVELPVRIELHGGAKRCRFTIAGAPFECAPAAGDQIDFRFDGWPYSVAATVLGVLHTVGSKCDSLVMCRCDVTSYDRVVDTFDLFKDSVKIVDLDADGDRPPAYYTVYRRVLELWGKKSFGPGDDIARLGSAIADVMCGSGPPGAGAAVDKLLATAGDGTLIDFVRNLYAGLYGAD